MNQFVIYDYDRSPTWDEINNQSNKIRYFEKNWCLSDQFCFDGYELISLKKIKAIYENINPKFVSLTKLEKINQLKGFFLSINPYCFYSDLDASILFKPELGDKPGYCAHRFYDCALWSGSGFEFKGKLRDIKQQGEKNINFIRHHF